MAKHGDEITDLNDLFVHTLRDIYYAEKQIEKALPRMADAANSATLRDAFSSHLDETQSHVSRLEKIFDIHGAEPKGVECPAIDGIIEEANDLQGDTGNPEVTDAALTAAAQAVEHYEMARYGALLAWARELGMDECASLLQETLREEEAADKKLSSIAEERVNARAA